MGRSRGREVQKASGRSWTDRSPREVLEITRRSSGQEVQKPTKEGLITKEV